jgi:hypothetical protein
MRVWLHIKEIDDNKLTEFWAKPVHNILPRTELLYKWNISDTPQCNACGTLETYAYFFLKCACLHSFWLTVGRVLEQTGFSDKLVSLQSSVIGYIVENRGNSEINYFLTVLGFSIYKSYYVSELRTKQIDTYTLMKKGNAMQTRTYEV